MTEIVWINGEFLPASNAVLPFSDSGLTNGLGVFDTMLAVDNVLSYPHDHFARLMRDADMVLNATPGAKDLVPVALKLLADNGLTAGRARIRTCITGGVIPTPLAQVTAPTIFMNVAAAPEKLAPIDAWIVPDFPRIAGSVLENCKRIDYTRAYAARRAAEKMGGNEALVTNTDGMVVCAATSNIFIVEGGQWFTPPLRDGALDGITRRYVMLEKSVKEESMLPERVLKADAVHLSNSIAGLRPLSSLNGKNY